MENLGYVDFLGRNQLDTVDPAAQGATRAWKDYVARWQPWNHVRTIATLLSAALYAVAALVMAS